MPSNGLLALVLVLVLVAACDAEGTDAYVTSTTQAVTAGEAAPGDPAVVALKYPDGSMGCSAAIIAPRLALTAAHCVRRHPSAVCLGAVFRDARCIATTTATAHPGYSPEPWQHDIAVVHLAEDAPVEPLAVVSRPLEDGELAGVSLRFVGFGTTKPHDFGVIQKRTGTSRIVEATPTELQAVASPSLTCGGDSGGPALATIDGREVVVAVTRSGDRACASFSRFTRVDAHRADFLDPQLKPDEVEPPGARRAGAPARRTRRGACSQRLAWRCAGDVKRGRDGARAPGRAPARSRHP